MLFLPFESFYISSPLKPGEIEQRLGAEVERPKGFTFLSIFRQQSSDRYFTGYVDSHRFEIKPAFVGRDSFIPEISGTIETQLNGSLLKVKMRLSSFVFAFMFLWLGIAGLAGLWMVFTGFTKEPFTSDSLAPLLIFLFGYLLMMGCFNYHSWSAKNKSCEILDGEIARIHH